jgi:hypothetical protein
MCIRAIDTGFAVMSMARNRDSHSSFKLQFLYVAHRLSYLALSVSSPSLLWCQDCQHKSVVVSGADRFVPCLLQFMNYTGLLLGEVHT